MTLRRGDRRKALPVGLVLMLLTTALAPLVASGAGVTIVTDPADDHDPLGGSASDILSLGATTNATHLNYHVEVAGADHPRLVKYTIAFTASGVAFEAFTSYTTDGEFTSSYVAPTSDPTDLRPIAASWSGTELTLSVERAHVGSPADGDVLTHVDATTSHGSTGVLFDETVTGDYRVGNSGAPVLDAVADQVVDENALLAFNVTATDPDADPITFASDSLPSGATLDATTGRFEWTPAYDQAGTHDVTVTASDGDAEGATSFTITVANVNRAPVLDPVGDRTHAETDLVAFAVTATDADGDNVTLTATGLPTDASFDAATGNFSWQTDHLDAGAHAVTFTATDGALHDSETVTITITDVNRPPDLQPIPDLLVREGQHVTFVLNATDPDTDNTLTFSNVSALPAGATLHPTTGAFAWKPSYEQAGIYPLTFRVTDGQDTDDESMTITVSDVNRPPVINPIGNQSVNESTLLAFVVSATDADGDPVTLTAPALPAGATFDASTGAFEWTPDFTQAGDHNASFRAEDDRGGVAVEDIVISVGNVNRAPVLDAVGSHSVDEGQLLTFTLNATDADEEDSLTFSADDLPAGATLNATSGGFEWTPDFTQAGDHVVTFDVTDGRDQDSETVTITVIDVNRAPVLDPIGNRTVDEGQLLAFTLTGSDVDDDAITFSASGLPAGATLNATSGAFEWTPDFTQAGDHVVTFIADDGQASESEDVTITVVNVNRPVVLDPVGDKRVNETVLLAFTLTASDADDEPLTFASGTLPAGATLDAETGAFEWTPHGQQNGAYTVTFNVTDGEFVDEETITITVDDVTAPAFDAVGNKVVDEGQLLTFTLTASDAHDDPLTFSGTLPGSATLNATTGAFEWTPMQADVGQHAVTFSVTDGVHEDSVSVTLTVLEDNVAPVLSEIPDVTSMEGDSIAFTLSATDPDGDDLTFAAAALPDGATLDATTGAFSWTPGYDQAGTFVVTFIVDDGSLTDEQGVSFTIADMVASVRLAGPSGTVQIGGSAPTSYTFTVTNDALGTDTMTVSAAATRGWTATSDAETFVLAAGESRDVTVTVQPNAENPTSRLTVTVSTLAGGSASGELDFVIPLFIDLAFASDTVDATTAVTGTVTVTDLNGDAVPGALATLRERGEAGFQRFSTVTTDENGEGHFEFDVSILGANAPGRHEVIAQIVGAPNAEATTTGTYEATLI